MFTIYPKIKKIIVLIILINSVLQLRAEEFKHFQTLEYFTYKISEENITNKTPGEILYVFFSELSNTFDLNLEVKYYNSILKIIDSENEHIFDCNSSKDVTYIFTYLKNYSRKLETKLFLNKINIELELYLCDFLISKIDNGISQQIILPRQFDVPPKFKEYKILYELRKNENGIFEIQFVENSSNFENDNKIIKSDNIVSINSIPLKYLTNGLLKSQLNGKDSIINIVLQSELGTIEKHQFISRKINHKASYSVSKEKNKTLILTINQFNILGAREAQEELKKKKYSRIIIDLRNNQGGLISVITDFLDLFLDKNDTIALIEYHTKTHNKILLSEQKKLIKNKNIIVLINKSTASGANIMAGVLKNKRGAILIGEKTIGKNAVNNIIILPPKNYFAQHSIGYFSIKNMEELFKNGISPDIYIEDRINNDLDEILNFSIKYEQ